MLKQVLYTARATASGGRIGNARSDDGTLDVTLTMPKGLGGGGEAGTNPEQLFAAGYSACFLSALKSIAREQKLKLPEDARIEAAVDIGPRAEGPGFGLAVALTVYLPGIDTTTGDSLLAAAHAICPYSNATRGNIAVTLTLG